MEGKSQKNFSINGRRTSLNLDNALWVGLQEIADSLSMKVGDVIAQVDQTRGDRNLTDAVRLYLFKEQRHEVKSAPTAESFAPNRGTGAAPDPSRALRKELDAAKKKIRQMEREIRDLNEQVNFYKIKYESRHLRMASDIMEVIKRHSNFISRSNDLAKLLEVVDRENDQK